MLVDFREIGEVAVRKAIKKGADYADVFFERRTSFFAKCEDDRIESVVSGMELGVGVRVIRNGRTFYGFTNNISSAAVCSIVDALASSGVPEGVSIDFRELDSVYDRVIEGGTDLLLPVDKKMEILRIANDRARSFGDYIKQVTVVLKDSIQEVTIVNSLGEIVEDVRPRVMFYVLVVASNGSELQTGYESTGHLGDYSLFEKISPEHIARVASERAVKMLEAKPSPAGVFTVVISSSAGGTMIHEAVGHGLEADLVFQGLSVYANKLGEKVASDCVTVIDDGTIPGMYGTFAYDDEGVPSQRTVLIEDGRLKGYMYDRLWAMESGALSTGNGRRESYMYPPIPRMRNTFIAPGDVSPDDVIEDTKRGIYVVKMGGGQVNTVNGDFVFEVNEGYMIENGKLSYPVRGVSLIGNGPKVLMDIDVVCNDLDFSIGMCGKDGQAVPVSDALPTVRIRSMTVGGTG